MAREEVENRRKVEGRNFNFNCHFPTYNGEPVGANPGCGLIF